MFQKLFEYCERGVDPSFWAEPLNAVTNAAFIIAAMMTTLIWTSQPRDKRGLFELFLIFLLYAIGTGSFLFHTFATGWAALADVIPIGIFMVSYLGYALRRFVGLNWVLTLLALVAFFLSLWQASVTRCDGGPCFNGSLAYFPAFAVLILVGVILVVRRHRAGPSLIAAGVIFAVSLTFRTLDQSICGYTVLPTADAIGTHFVWHVLNATLLYLLVRAALKYGTRGNTVPLSQ